MFYLTTHSTHFIYGYVASNSDKLFVLLIYFRRDDNMDVEVSASGFTKEMARSFDEVSYNINSVCSLFAP